MNWGSVVSSGDGKDEPVINHPEAREIFAAVRLNPKKQPTLRNYCPGDSRLYTACILGYTLRHEHDHGYLGSGC
jgi:hypothetical protein